ncbi:MAG: MerR family transcriptional regulator [Lachnospiraceae bacterium]|nr:MerR family transcriptional regulator [Lachnospiraceae bacterium]
MKRKKSVTIDLRDKSVVAVFAYKESGVMQMEYNTNDLSKILDVTTNTIRRYEEKGFLNPQRNDQNGYRIFDNSDLEKAIYIERYRKNGFDHNEIEKLFHENMGMGLRRFQIRMKEIDEKISELMATRQMLSDDVILMKKGIAENKEITEKKCQSLYYILHHRNGHTNMEGKNGIEYRKFMEKCPELKYIYIFDKENVERERLVYSEGIAAKELLMGLYGVEIEPSLKHYESRPSIMRFVKIPIDMEKEEQMSKEKLKKLLFGDFLEYTNQKNLRITGDMLGVKIGFSYEDDSEWQYVLLSVPVEEI